MLLGGPRRSLTGWFSRWPAADGVSRSEEPLNRKKMMGILETYRSGPARPGERDGRRGCSRPCDDGTPGLADYVDGGAYAR